MAGWLCRCFEPSTWSVGSQGQGVEGLGQASQVVASTAQVLEAQLLGEPLGKLSVRGTNPSDLAASSLITTGAMTARLDRLEEAGLIDRVADHSDGRAVRIRLTPRGTRLAKRALLAPIAADKAFLEHLNERRRRSFALLLKRLLVPHENS